MIGDAMEASEPVVSLGARLRERRTSLGLRLADVASGAAVSEGFLSQLERDRSSASVATLQRICAQLRMQVGDLFAEQRTSTVHRHVDAEFKQYGTGARKVRLTPQSNTKLETFYGELEPHGETGPDAMPHGDSEEVLLVLDGAVELTVGSQVHTLGPRDAVSYRSTSPHRVREIAGDRATVVWMIAPPSF